jgi:hypothetical protein
MPFKWNNGEKACVVLFMLYQLSASISYFSFFTFFISLAEHWAQTIVFSLVPVDAYTIKE